MCDLREGTRNSESEVREVLVEEVTYKLGQRVSRCDAEGSERGGCFQEWEQHV